MRASLQQLRWKLTTDLQVSVLACSGTFNNACLFQKHWSFRIPFLFVGISLRVTWFRWSRGFGSNDKLWSCFAFPRKKICVRHAVKKDSFQNWISQPRNKLKNSVWWVIFASKIDEVWDFSLLNIQCTWTLTQCPAQRDFEEVCHSRWASQRQNDTECFLSVFWCRVIDVEPV